MTYNHKRIYVPNTRELDLTKNVGLQNYKWQLVKLGPDEVQLFTIITYKCTANFVTKLTPSPVILSATSKAMTIRIIQLMQIKLHNYI